MRSRRVTTPRYAEPVEGVLAYVAVVLALLAVLGLVLRWRARRGGDSGYELPARTGPVEDAPRALERTEQSDPAPAVPDDAVSLYLPAERFDELLVERDDVFPLRLDLRQGWMIERTTGLRVNVSNRHLLALGIWSVRVRGDEHHAGEAHPGRPARLVREPSNPHDRNAIAIYSETGKVGYWNRQMAARLAKILDAGDPIEALFIRSSPPKVVAAAPDTMARLLAD